MIKKTNVLGSNIAITNLKKVSKYLIKNIQNLRGEYITLTNVHTSVLAYEDENYRMVQNSAYLALPDGRPLALVQRMQGYKQARQTAGPDLMEIVWKLTENTDIKHYFWGSSEETIDKLQKSLKKKYPGLKIAGMESPPYRQLTEEEDKDTVNRINDSGADILWVGLGAPKQEQWMYEHKGKINALMFGVGAGFDFHAGTLKRAPKWMRTHYLEWLFRLFQEPKRLWKRYLLSNAKFLFYVTREFLTNKKKLSKKVDVDNKKLKIAMIGHKRIPGREGGIEIVVYELSKRMVQQGHKVVAYNRSGHHVSGSQYETVDYTNLKKYQGIDIVTVPTIQRKGFAAFVYSFFASLSVIGKGYDVVHYHAEGPCAFLWIPHMFGIRTVVTIHGLDWQRNGKWGKLASSFIKFGEKVACKYADEIIVLSHREQRYFKNHYNRKTHLIPNGINRPQYKEAEVIKEKYALNKDDYILSLSRITREKKLDLLIKAYQQVNTDKKLVIAGGCSDDSAYMKELYKLAKADDRIIFTGFVQGQEIEELYSNAYIYCLPSEIEGMPISLLEAMSYGNCCLVSDIAENTEVINDKGISFTCNNIDNLKERLVLLVNNKKEVLKYKDTVADYVCNKYKWDNVVEATLNLYRKVK